jgi:hypothetical protein
MTSVSLQPVGTEFSLFNEFVRKFNSFLARVGHFKTRVKRGF